MVLNVLHPSIDARYIRVHPKTWRGHISMRMELLGCPSGTNVSFFHFLVKKETEFPLIDKSARISPFILIQLQFSLCAIGQSKSEIFNQFDRRYRYAFYLIILGILRDADGELGRQRGWMSTTRSSPVVPAKNKILKGKQFSVATATAIFLSRTDMSTFKEARTLLLES